jgi:hypothetical protein
MMHTPGRESRFIKNSEERALFIHIAEYLGCNLRIAHRAEDVSVAIGATNFGCARFPDPERPRARDSLWRDLPICFVLRFNRLQGGITD